MGRGVAKIFAQKGANVVIVARDVKKLEAAVEYIKVNFTHLPNMMAMAKNDT
jgi:short-subunit dehydrogenase